MSTRFDFNETSAPQLWTGGWALRSESDTLLPFTDRLAAAGGPLAWGASAFDISSPYDLAGSDPAAARDGANALLLHSANLEGGRHGTRWLHPASGCGADDSLFLSNRAFGTRTVDLFQARTAIDVARYGALDEASAAATDRSVDALNAQDFFPAYRA